MEGQMRKFATILLTIFCLTAVNYGQKQPSPIRGRLGVFWGPIYEAGRRDVIEKRRQIELDWMRQNNELQRYGVALRLEREANARAEYAERNYPNSPYARAQRQAATQASMYRARQEMAGQLRVNNSLRKYGIERTPTTRQFWPQGQPRSTPGNSRPVVERGGSGNRYEVRDRPQQNREGNEAYRDRLAARATSTTQPSSRLTDRMGLGQLAPRIDKKDLNRAFPALNSKAFEPNWGLGSTQRSAPQRNSTPKSSTPRSSPQRSTPQSRDSQERSRSDSPSRSGSSSSSPRESGSWQDAQRARDNNRP